MSFLNPTLALAALACIAAPIIIHLLFRRKRKPVEWGAMKFVLEAFRRHRRRLRLEQILLLAARTLAVLCLALAVGRPMFSGTRTTDSRRARDLTIVIDNSLASRTLSGGASGQSEFEAAKRRADKLLDELDAGRGDRATIITLAAPAERLLAAPSGDLAGVRRVLDQIEPADSGADFSGAAALARDANAPDAARESTIALLSSLRAGSIDLSRETPGREAAAESTSAPADHLPSIVVSTPATEPATNAAIVAIEPLRSMLIRAGEAASTQQVRVSLKRFGPGVEQPAAIQLRLRVTDGHDGDDEKLWAKTAVRFAAGEDSVTVLAPIAMREFKDGVVPAASWIEGRIDDDAIPSDNVFRRPWRIREQLRVGLLAPLETPDVQAGPAGYSASDWLTLALAPDSASSGVDLDSDSQPIRITRIDPTRVTVAELSVVDAAIVTRPDLIDAPSWPLLGDFARRGGLLVVCAAPKEGPQLWTDAFVKATSIAWSFERESMTFKEPPNTRSLRGANIDQPIIAALGADLSELIKPVVATRLLGVDLKSDGAWLLRFDDKLPMLASTPPGGDGGTKGLIVAFFVSPQLSWTNLPAMPLMVPLVQEIVRQGVGLASGSVELTAGATFESPDDLRAVEPKNAGAAPTVARQSGLWRRVDARGSTKEVVAVNADSRGSSTATQEKAALEPFLRSWGRGRDFSWNDTNPESPGGASGVLGSPKRSPPIDLPLLIAGLALLIADVAFSRLFSHATARTNRADGPESNQSTQPEVETIREVAA